MASRFSSLNRRAFLQASTLAGATVLAGTTIVDPIYAQSQAVFVPAHTLPALGYAYNALEPFIDAQTMELHHSKHHKAYVDGLNKAEAELAKARSANDFALVQHWSKQAAFHGGGHFLHTLFWSIMADPKNGGGGEPSGMLADKIKEDFGGFDAFKKHFTAVSTAVEGSGWGLLHYRPHDKKLVILQAENQHKLSAWGVIPIMGIDVWEHAYYLKYQNKRADYVNAWWNVVNWKQVQNNLQMAMK
jgi:superoxide dismutase, Fe-Mn family